MRISRERKACPPKLAKPEGVDKRRLDPAERWAPFVQDILEKQNILCLADMRPAQLRKLKNRVFKMLILFFEK